MSSYNHSVIDIGLYKKGSAQVGFKKGNNYYNQIGSDYTVPAAGVSDSDGLYVQTMNETNGGGAMVFQANKNYTLTIDETQGSNNGSPNGLITISVSSPAANSTYGLTGNIDSTYIASINGVTNTISQGDIAAATWWPMYHAAAAISTVESTDVYSITFTTVDAATLAANGHSNIDIGLSTTSDQQKGFTINGENYNTVGSDYKLTSAGITNAPIISATGGSIQFQPGRTYKVTVNESNNSTVTIQCTSGDKYFLAGQYSDGTPQFFGYSWNTANNELPLSSGTTYTKTFSTANQDTIAAGTINFKVVKNGDSDGWDGGSYPSGNTNQSYVIRANPTSVTFSFDSSTGVTTVTQTNTSGGETTTSGWLYSGTAAAERTEVDPTDGFSTFDASTTADGDHGKFRFMYNTTDPGLNNVKIPEKYKGGTNSNGYWAELTSSMTQGSNFYFCLSNYWSVNNIVGNGSEEINDSTSNKSIVDVNGANLFKIQRRQNGTIHSDVRYILIYDVDWTKVSAIGVRAYDNSKATNNSNPRNNKVDYQIFYKAKGVTPVEEAKVVDIIAKNGTIRDNTFNRFTNLADTNIEDYFYYSEIVSGNQKDAQAALCCLCE